VVFEETEEEKARKE